ncbi:MAG: 3'-5' exonuclease, partial [Patescibacteria group bacterium]
MSPALFRDAISLKKNGGEDALDERKRERILHTFSLYEAALERNNAFDFDDLIEKTTLLLRSDENLRKKYLERFSHVFVDEYQDLNRSQHELIRLLVGEHTSLTAVGDAEQTIYGWRGSDIRIFFSFPSEWKKSHLTALDQNYRSTKNILEAAGSVITENEYESDIPRAINLSTDRGEGERIQIYAAEDEEDEAVWVASRALGNKEESIAVLYRTNAQSRPIEAALIAYNIPYHIYGGIKFYERREIKDILAGLRLAVNPHDEISRERLEKALTKRRAKVLFEKLPLLAEKAPKEAVESFVRDAEYLPYIEEHLTNPSDRLENVEELIRFASEFTSLSVFLERITLLQSTDTKEERGSAHIRHPVQLMTMHMAKGLEFDCVFVLGVNEGFIPHVRSTKSLGAIQEERRLLYVAMTRARKNLSLSFYGIPSRFLSPLRSENITWIGIKNSYEAYADEENYITLD